MATADRAQEFHDAIRKVANANALRTSDLALIVGQMLAAAKLWPHDRNGTPGFLEQERELTNADWMTIAEKLGRQWKVGPGRIDNPFEEANKASPLSPGVIERLRRIILEVLTGDSLNPSIPFWILQCTLELTDHDGLLGRGPMGVDSNLRELIVALASAQPMDRAFCAYDGAAGIALALAANGVAVTLDVYSPLAPLCACLALAGDFRLNVRSGDPMALARADIGATEPVSNSYDISIVLPPWNERRGQQKDDDLGTGLPRAVNSESAGITLALARGQKAALCLVPPSFLFQTSKADQVFKEQAIKRFGLDTIVGLPRGALFGSSIAPSLLLFKPARAAENQSKIQSADHVYVTNAQVGWDHFDFESKGSCQLARFIENHEPTSVSVLVPIIELAANDFNLTVERYVLDPETRRLRELTASQSTISLDDVAELYRPQAIPSAKILDEVSQFNVAEVGVADIDKSGVVRSASKRLKVSPDAAPQVRRSSLQVGDVLLVIKGSVGKVGFVRDIPHGQTWVASQSFSIVRLRQHAPLIDPRILFRFLISSVGQASMQSMRVGVAVPGLQMADVRRLSILLPDKKMQGQIANEVEGLFELQDKIHQLDHELSSRQENIWPELLGLPSGRNTEVARNQTKSSSLRNK